MNRAWTVAGATASAAARIGVPVDEYRRRRASGERWCAWHRGWHPQSRFAFDAVHNRVMSYCPEGHREASRAAVARLRARQRGATA